MCYPFTWNLQNSFEIFFGTKIEPKSHLNYVWRLKITFFFLAYLIWNNFKWAVNHIPFLHTTLLRIQSDRTYQKFSFTTTTTTKAKELVGFSIEYIECENTRNWRKSKSEFRYELDEICIKKRDRQKNQLQMAWKKARCAFRESLCVSYLFRSEFSPVRFNTMDSMWADWTV